MDTISTEISLARPIRQQQFKMKQFRVRQDRCDMKVTSDACLFGALIEGVHTRACDIGTGTGLLSLMIAQRCRAQIDALDIDPQAVIQANENFAESPFHTQLRALRRDVSAPEPAC